jgi:transposase
MDNDVEKARHSLFHLLRSGHSPEEAATELGYCLSWVYKWRGRFEEAGWGGLESQSRAPHRHPTRISAKTERKILEIRAELEEEAQKPNALSYIGAPAIRGRLLERRLKTVPSISTIEKVLREAGVTKPRPTQAKPKTVYPRLHVEQPHQLTQMDNVPHFLRGGALVNCFNAIDVTSRYPEGKQYERKSTDEVLDFCLRTFHSLRIAEYTQMDNESSFNGGRTYPYVIGRVPHLMLLVGTQLVFSPYYHPKSNAYIERFHQDYIQNVWQKMQLQDLAHVRQISARFFGRYRLSRHHSELHGQSPATLHFAARRASCPKASPFPNTCPLRKGKSISCVPSPKTRPFPFSKSTGRRDWRNLIRVCGRRYSFPDKEPDSASSTKRLAI